MSHNPHANALRAAHAAWESARDAATERGLIGIGVELATASERAALNDALSRFLTYTITID